MKKWGSQLALLWIIFLAWIVYHADIGTLPAMIARIYFIPYGDKVGHLLLMGTLALLLNFAFPSWRMRLFNSALPAGSLLAGIIVTLEEFSQLFFKTRTFELGDLAADYIGIALIGTFLFFWIRHIIKPELTLSTRPISRTK